PRGGFPSSSPGGNDAIWSDNIPWYHDEILPPGVTDDKDDPFTAAGNVSADGNSIGYYDNPHFDADAKPGAVMEFRTWLVLVNAPDAGATAAYRPVAFLGGFQWQVTKKADGGRTTEIHHRTDTDYPDTSDYEQLLNIPAWFDTDPAHLAPYASASDPKK
ncbi:MAG TPA: hypothetical protein VJT74_12300, partial [Pyrinomonadaceae bacterium]|nr:hypothetical protein [Pyrinomonadaceae bacterium]